MNDIRKSLSGKNLMRSVVSPLEVYLSALVFIMLPKCPRLLIERPQTKSQIVRDQYNTVSVMGDTVKKAKYNLAAPMVSE